jgi:hypothetical protein
VDGDGRSDIALTGGGGWNTIPVAFSNGDGTFRVKNQQVPVVNGNNFPQFATASGVQVIAGDFDGDGLSDIALTGVAGWNTIPVAFSNGDGTFHVTNNQVTSFPQEAASAGVRTISGDFDGDGRGDMCVAASGFFFCAVSVGGGNFNFADSFTQSQFWQWAAGTGVKPVGAY